MFLVNLCLCLVHAVTIEFAVQTGTFWGVEGIVIDNYASMGGMRQNYAGLSRAIMTTFIIFLSGMSYVSSLYSAKYL